MAKKPKHRKGPTDSKKASRVLSDADVDVIVARSKQNLIAKVARGGVLTAGELRQVESMRSESKPAPAPPEPEDERVWITPAEFERWLPTQGVTISHKSLYKTYLGANARHPIKRNSAGRVHRDFGLELVRMVQGHEEVHTDDAIAKRNAADARIKSARAALLEATAAERAGRKIDVDLVNTKWSRAIENLKNELRALASSVSAMLVGKTELEITAILEKRYMETLRHLADGYVTTRASAT
jgi:hypothetical protein